MNAATCQQRVFVKRLLISHCYVARAPPLSRRRLMRVQAATSFVNDSLLTTVCVRYRPDEVAAAVVYLSYLYMGLPRVDAKLLDTDEAVVAGESRMRRPCLSWVGTTFCTWPFFSVLLRCFVYVAMMLLETAMLDADVQCSCDA